MISVKLPQEAHQYIKGRAKRNGITVSAYARRLILLTLRMPNDMPERSPPRSFEPWEMRLIQEDYELPKRRRLGPTQLANLLGRSPGSIAMKAAQMGFARKREV